MKKNLLILGVVLVSAGFLVQLFPAADATVSGFPVGAYAVGSISGLGLCLIGYGILHNFLSRFL